MAQKISSRSINKNIELAKDTSPSKVNSLTKGAVKKEENLRDGIL